MVFKLNLISLGTLEQLKLTLIVCFICPLVVIDPTDLGATTELLLQALCLFIFNQSPTQDTCILPGYKGHVNEVI